jgi:hypothetical protein
VITQETTMNSLQRQIEHKYDSIIRDLPSLESSPGLSNRLTELHARIQGK